MSRETLPNRRSSLTVPALVANTPTDVTLGFYPDGRLGEVFVDPEKMTSTVALQCRDVAVLISLGLQHGASLDTIEAALLKHETGEPASFVGEVVRSIRDTVTALNQPAAA